MFYPVLQAETQQKWYPRLLLSDYENSIEAALGLIPVPYEKALNGQEGLTTLTLGGGTNKSNYTGPSGYDAGVQACWTPWHKAYPQIPPSDTTDYLEQQGPVVSWCEAIALFAKAAGRPAPTSTDGPSSRPCPRSTDFPGTWTPVLSFGPTSGTGRPSTRS